MGKKINKKPFFTNLVDKSGGHYSQTTKYSNFLFTAGTVGIGHSPNIKIVKGCVKNQIR